LARRLGRARLLAGLRSRRDLAWCGVAFGLLTFTGDAEADVCTLAA